MNKIYISKDANKILTDYLEGLGCHLSFIAAEDSHRAEAEGETPVFVAGDTRNGSSLVVTAIADGLACAKEAAEAL